QRVRESVLLRTLGGNKRQVSSILSVEYLLLGSLAVLTGLLLSGLISWGLAVFYFDITFKPAFGPLLGISLGIILLSLAIGRAASRTIFRHAPNEILRMQNG
ncbi:MAG: FtsX-like permease family protein, partial [Balneolaceae bacterium]